MPPVSSSKGRPPDCQKTGTQWRFVNIGGPQETKNEELRRMVRVNAARAHWRRQGKNRSNRQPAGDSGHQREKSKARTSSLEFTQRDHDPMTGSQVEGIFSGYDMEEVSDGLEIVKLGEFGSKRSRFLRHKGFTKMVHSQNVTIGDQNDLRGSLQASIIPNSVTTDLSTDWSPRHNRCLLSDCKLPLIGLFALHETLAKYVTLPVEQGGLLLKSSSYHQPKTVLQQKSGFPMSYRTHCFTSLP